MAPVFAAPGPSLPPFPPTAHVNEGNGPSPQKSGLPNRFSSWPKPWASESSSRLWASSLVLEGAAHLEVEAVADQHERNVVERVRIALAQFVGPDDQRVVEQAAAAARLGGLGQPLGQVGQSARRTTC